MKVTIIGLGNVGRMGMLAAHYSCSACTGSTSLQAAELSAQKITVVETMQLTEKPSFEEFLIQNTLIELNLLSEALSAEIFQQKIFRKEKGSPLAKRGCINAICTQKKCRAFMSRKSRPPTIKSRCICLQRLFFISIILF